MDLEHAVTSAFAPGGVLSQRIQNFTPRSGQMEMANAVAKCLAKGGALAVEAGTGVGKTFAYLVPALLSGERVLLSTATKTLQDQLFGRDIPRLLEALGIVARVALLKGRGSYLCSHRLSLARDDVRTLDVEARQDIARVERWAVSTRTGDLAELIGVDETSAVIARITSTRDNCLGADCPQIQGCHVNQARRNAMASDVVVINHHLYFADMNIRESGVAELLPAARTVVFDEAHQLNDIGVQFLGLQLTTAQLDNYCRDLALYGARWSLADSGWSEMVAQLSRCVSELHGIFRNTAYPERLAWDGDQPVGVDAQVWKTTVEGVHAALQLSDAVLRSVEDLSADLKQLREHASRLMASLHVFEQPIQPGWVRWVQRGHTVKLIQAPLDISETMRSRMRLPDSALECGQSWIFTSATLGHDATLAEFVEMCGLENAQVLQVSSPFDFFLQAALYIPENFPKPDDAMHSASVASLVARGASVLGGRTLVLTTTLRAMREIAQNLRQYFSEMQSMAILVQGESPKNDLIECMRQGADPHASNCILVASASFWEGIDIPGDALQLVVIDKLPFPPPSDPLIAARSRRCRDKGINPFQKLHVPQTAIALKQGAGRLIRQESDRGVLVVCDVRLAKMPYGRRILSALPEMRRIDTEDGLLQALGQLTKPSTRDLP
jgi:ATP-dependent DNA helicase DinG